MAARPIGIDLGTTYSCAAQVQDGKPVVIASRLGYTTLPSVVNFDEKGHVVVGQPAERRMILHPTETIYGSKRLLGRTWDPSVIERYQPHFDYELVADAAGLVAAKVLGKVVPLVQVSAMILRELRMAVQTTLGERVEQAVVTVPAYFNENQRDAVRQAGTLAGLEVLKVLKEPTAAALCYGMGRGERKNVLVFDLGGGTFDISVININHDTFEVLGVGGDNFLGGIDFDRRLVEVLVGRLEAKNRGSIELDPVGRERLRAACQDAKRQLSSQEKTLINLLHFQLADGSQLDVSEVFSREELELATADLVERCMQHVVDTLSSVGKRPNQIDDVLLVGGQTRMLAVQKAVEKLFGKPASKRVHPDEAVALGAAIAADSHDRSGAVVLLDVVPMAIGFMGPQGELVPVVARHTPLPHETQMTVTLDAPKPRLELAVYQGDRMGAAENDYLGTLVLEDLPETTDAVRCTLSFSMNADGLLQISASVPEFKVQRTLKLLTMQASDTALSAVDVERVRVSRPRVSAAGAAPTARKSVTRPSIPRADAPRATNAARPAASRAKSPSAATRRGAAPPMTARAEKHGLFARVFGPDGWLRSMFR